MNGLIAAVPYPGAVFEVQQLQCALDHSVKLRTPLVNACLLRDSQPLQYSLKTFPHKNLLTEASACPLPRDILKRKKTGFSIPVHRCIQQEIQDKSLTISSRKWAKTLASTYSREML